MSTDRPATAPLAGIVVVELGHSVAAPYAGQILADLGAEVVKIEKPDGDDARRWGPPFLDGESAIFKSMNRGKRSVAVRLADPAQRDALVRFIEDEADVVLQNLRPGQVDRLGLDAATLCARKPALVYCNVGAFGSIGPLAGHPGYDPLMQAFGGIMSVVGEPGWPSVRVGPSIIDCGTAMWGVIGIIATLMRRRETGVGGVVDVSLFETAVGWMTQHAAKYVASGEVPRKTGSGQEGIAPYRAFRTADGELVVAAGSDALFARLCNALDQAQWLDDPRFVSNPARVENEAVLNAAIATAIERHDTAHWIARLGEAGVPCAPVQDTAQMLAHPQTRALGIVQDVPGSSAPLVGLPIRFDGARAAPTSAAPALDADADRLRRR